MWYGENFIILTNCFSMIHLCDGQTARWTDRRAIAYGALNIYAVAR